jgi:WhiB family redox-sensing transcriptional regulator
MPVPMSGGRANLPGSMQDAIARGPRHNSVEVLAQPTLEPSHSCDSIARPARPANAACQGMGPDFFFPANAVGLARVRRICAQCPVAEQCLATALDDPSLHGIWAGTSARERQYLRSEEGLGWG